MFPHVARALAAYCRHANIAVANGENTVSGDAFLVSDSDDIDFAQDGGNAGRVCLNLMRNSVSSNQLTKDLKLYTVTGLSPSGNGQRISGVIRLAGRCQTDGRDGI